MLFQQNLSRKISPEKSLDFWSQKSVLRPALSSPNVSIKLGFDEMVLGIDAPNKLRIPSAEGSEAPSGNLSVLPVGRVRSIPE